MVISNDLLSSTKNSRVKYQQYLDDKNKEREQANVNGRRKLLERELEEMQKNVKRIKSVIAVLMKDADEYAERAAKLASVADITKSVAFRNEAKKKEMELSELETLVGEKRRELSSC